MQKQTNAEKQAKKARQQLAQLVDIKQTSEMTTHEHGECVVKMQTLEGICKRTKKPTLAYITQLIQTDETLGDNFTKLVIHYAIH